MGRNYPSVDHPHAYRSLPAARLLQHRTGAPTYGFGPHVVGKYEKGAKVEEGSIQIHP